MCNSHLIIFIDSINCFVKKNISKNVNSLYMWYEQLLAFSSYLDFYINTSEKKIDIIVLLIWERGVQTQ